jgi:hypothetical protein
MLSPLNGLRQTQTHSVLGLRTALSSPYLSVAQLLQVNLIHQQYLSEGGHNGVFGLPTSAVQQATGSRE